MLTPTVIICTHNGARRLGPALAAALREVRQAGGEILVVDNASTDETAVLLRQQVTAEAPTLQVTSEPQLGLSHARNRGLWEMRGAIAVFLDDDAIPYPGWLPALLDPYAPDVACTGGPIRLRFEAAPPPWLTAPLRAMLGEHDLGSEPCAYPRHDFPRGGNISFRADLVRALGGFSAALGVRGNRRFQLEETDVCAQLAHAGYTSAYAPGAVVDHCIPATRLTPQWFLAHQSVRGQSAALYIMRAYGVRRALGWLRWHHWPSLFLSRYQVRDPVDAERLEAELRRQEAWGYVRGLLAYLPRYRSLRLRHTLPART